MTGRDVVSWAGPVEKRAAHRIREGTEALEAKRFAAGVEHLRRAQRHLDQAIEFIRKTEQGETK
jgi:hypothetical protein